MDDAHQAQEETKKEEFLNSSGVVWDEATKGHEFAFGARSFVTYSFVAANIHIEIP